jgi:hypothetical protein
VLQISSILQLLICWQAEDFFADGKLSVNLLLVEPEVDDVEES